MKRIVSFILTAALAAGLFAVPCSAAVSDEDGITALMRELDIMRGDENGDMGLDRLVSRAEFAKIAIAASPAKNTVAAGLKMSPYRDVPYTEWYAPYVRAAVSAGYIKGYLDATYRPENTVSYEEAVTVMLRVLNYDDSSFGAAYPYGQIAQAQGLDMLDGVDGEIGSDMTRRQVMRLIYNTLQANVKSTQSASSLSAQSGMSAAGQTGAQSGAPSSSGTAAFSGTLLSAHECSMTEDVDIIAGFEQDNSLGTDKIFTSAGTYTKGVYFDDSCVGMTGTAFIKNSKDIVAFVPDSGYPDGGYETYFVYSTLANSVVGYNNGSFETIDIPDSTGVYRDRTRTTYAAVKGGLEMGDTLYVKRASGGSIDYITFESGSMTGPVKVTSSAWADEVGAGQSSTVMRDGERSGASSVLINDIIYYSAPLDMVFAYSNKVTGVYESASPTKDSPASVTISGKEYAIEGVDAFDNLSSSGTFSYGDTVTICLGKDGGAAGVVTEETASVSDKTLVAYITDAGRRLFTDSNGREYSSYYVSAVSADGNVGTYETEYDRSYLKGQVCSVTFTDGVANVSRRSSVSSVSGRVSYDKREIGNYSLSPNVNILDVSNDNIYGKVLYKKIYPQRLDGMTLNGGQILYSERNAMNEITTLILNNVTGDVYTYGVVSTSNGGTYSVDINGEVRSYQMGTGYEYRGPARLVLDSAGLGGIITLSSYKGSVTSLTHTTAVIGNIEYKLSSDVVCYTKSVSAPYKKITIEEAISGDYNITAYYDKTESNGGRIRILVCEG